MVIIILPSPHFYTYVTKRLCNGGTNMNTKSIVSKIRKQLKKNGAIPTQKEIQITLLRDTLNTYFEANRLIEENGYIMTFNDGKTKGQNPMIKVKLDSLKIIIKLLKDIFEDVDEDDTDAFMEWLTKG